jgi:hypothetical protein
MVKLVAECFQGGPQRGVEVYVLVFGLVQPGEIAQVLHDGADPLRNRWCQICFRLP